MGIGTLRTAVMDVNDLTIAEAFWSQVTGLEVLESYYPGRYGYLGHNNPWRHELILHLVTAVKGPETNRGHIDIGVRDMDRAIGQVEAIGGRLKKAPALYPRPHSYPGEEPSIDWAVMQDPFGNEFCLITILSPEQSAAVTAAAQTSDGPDPAADPRWRAVARRAAQ